MSKTDIYNSGVTTMGPVVLRQFVPSGNVAIAGTWKTTESKSPMKTVSEQRSGLSTPKFLTRLGPVPPPVNNFYYERYEKHYWNGSETTRRRDVQPHAYLYKDESYVGLTPIGNTYPYDPITNDDKSRLESAAAQKLRADLKDQNVNYGQAFAERQQTIDLFGNTARRIYQSYKDLRHGDIASAARHLGVQVGRRRRAAFNKSFARNQAESVSRGWLELQYGWKPLLSDVYGAAEDLAQSYTPEFQKVTVRKTIRRTLSQTINELGTASNVSGSYKTFLNGEARYTVRIGCTFTVSSSQLRRASQMGLTNPATLAWELLPFSFVADWFMPIGNWINSWDSTLGLDFKDGFKTTFSVFEGNGTVACGYTYLPEQTTFSKLYTSKLKTVKVQRAKLFSFPAAVAPSFKNPLSVTHAANALALLFSIFKR